MGSGAHHPQLGPLARGAGAGHLPLVLRLAHPRIQTGGGLLPALRFSPRQRTERTQPHENRRDGPLREQAGRNAREASMSSPRKAKRTASAKATSHGTQCFAEILSRDPELSALRADHAQKPARKRRAAAEWVYDESIS